MSNQSGPFQFGSPRNSVPPPSLIESYERYVASKALKLSDEARQTLLKVEETARHGDCWVGDALFLSVLLRDCYPLRMLLARHELDAESAAAIAEKDALYKDAGYSDHYDDSDLARYVDPDGLSSRALVGRGAIASAVANNRSSILRLDLLAGLFESHEMTSSPLKNGDWVDERLHVPYNTLSHVLGRFFPELWIRTDVIKSELGLMPLSLQRGERVSTAPAHIRGALRSFFTDHPDYRRNCFLIMPFAESIPLVAIHAAVKSTFSEFGFKVLRADDKVYAESLFANIETYMHGCRFAISVHERSASEVHNANVALEVGYMLGMRRDVCILKEDSVQSLPSDLQGRLYTTFDVFNIESTLRTSIGRWLRDRRLQPTDSDS